MPGGGPEGAQWPCHRLGCLVLDRAWALVELDWSNRGLHGVRKNHFIAVNQAVQCQTFHSGTDHHKGPEVSLSLSSAAASAKETFCLEPWERPRCHCLISRVAASLLPYSVRMETSEGTAWIKPGQLLGGVDQVGVVSESTCHHALRSCAPWSWEDPGKLIGWTWSWAASSPSWPLSSQKSATPVALPSLHTRGFPSFE